MLNFKKFKFLEYQYQLYKYFRGNARVSTI